MYCGACGQPLEASQAFCQKCGRQSAPLASYAPAPYNRNRVHRHMHTVAVLWIIAVGFLVGAYTHWAHMGHGFDGLYAFPFIHATWLVPLITAVLVGRAILCVVTGISLMRRASWARVLAIVTAFLAIIHPFAGTVLGIYTLWVLLPSASGQEYEQMLVAG
jgi:hypothetical protein